MSEPLIQTPGVFGENENFLLERELGTGGMGGVYMGRDKMLDRPVAVKVMLKEYGDDPEFVEKAGRIGFGDLFLVSHQSVSCSVTASAGTGAA